MEITEIEATYGRKVQLDQFEPIEYRETITATLEDGDDPEEASEELQKVARDNVERGILNRVMVHKMENSDDE